MKFADLIHEYQTETIGDRIYSLVRELCAVVARRYPAGIYNDGTPWTDAEFDALCNEIVLDQLIERGQLDYVFTEADSYESARRLLTRQIKRGLVERRKVGPVDRLLRRARAIYGTGQIESAGPGGFRRSGTEAIAKPLSDQQIRRCSAAASPVPRLASRIDASRESMIYSAQALEEVLTLVLDEVQAVSESDLRRIFGCLLTPWTPTTLVPVEESHISSDDGADGYAMDVAMNHSLLMFAESLSQQERTVLVLKSQGIPDTQVAEVLGMSRPTAAKIKDRVLTRVSDALTEIEPNRHDLAMSVLLEHTIALAEEAS